MNYQQKNVFYRLCELHDHNRDDRNQFYSRSIVKINFIDLDFFCCSVKLSI